VPERLAVPSEVLVRTYTAPVRSTNATRTPTGKRRR
jgi:hypothetical protein